MRQRARSQSVPEAADQCQLNLSGRLNVPVSCHAMPVRVPALLHALLHGLALNRPLRTLLALRDGDALVALVNEHWPKDLRLVLEEATRRRVPIVLLTDTLSGMFARQVSVALAAPRGDAASFKSLATAGVLLDVLLLAITAREPARSLRAIEEFGRLRSPGVEPVAVRVHTQQSADAEPGQKEQTPAANRAEAEDEQAGGEEGT